MINWSGKFVSVHEFDLREHDNLCGWLPSPLNRDVLKYTESVFCSADRIAEKKGYRLHHSFWTPAGFVFVFIRDGELSHGEV